MQSVIIYRNPLEAYVWQSLMEGGSIMIFLSVLALGVLWVITYIITAKIERKVGLRGFNPKYAIWVASAVTCITTLSLIVF